MFLSVSFVLQLVKFTKQECPKKSAYLSFLPATPDSLARYLADYAGKLAANTLQQRVAALAQWHIDQGFPDPSKTLVVRKVLKGIRTLHPAQEKQARPLQLAQLSRIVHWLGESSAQAAAAGQRGAQLRHVRDRALLLLGFWRGFRGDELTRLQVEHIEAVVGKGMILKRLRWPVCARWRHIWPGSSWRAWLMGRSSAESTAGAISVTPGFISTALHRFCAPCLTRPACHLLSNTAGIHCGVVLPPGQHPMDGI
jgi:hypothetical protein